MKRNPLAAVLLVAVAVAIAVGIVLLSDTPEEPVKESKVPLLGEEKADVASVTVTNEKGGYVLTKTVDTFSIDGIPDEALNTGKAATAYRSIASLKSIGISGAGGQVKSTPAAEAVVKEENGSETTLYLGKKADEADGYYMWTDRSEDVYLVDEFIRDVMIWEATSFRNMNLIDFTYDSDYDDLEEISIEGKDLLTMSFVRTEDGFMMTLPVKHPCFQRDLKVMLLDGIMHLAGDSYVGKGTSRELGFDDPRYRITMRYKGKALSLLFGDEIGGGCYVMNTATNDVYIVSSDKIAFPSVDYRSAVGSVLYYRDISEVASFAVAYGGETSRFDVKKTGDTYVAVSNGEEYSYSRFIQAYNPLIELTLKKRLTDGVEETAEGAIEAVIVLNDGRQERLVLRKLSEREYSLQINDMKAFSTPTADAEAITEQIKRLKG